MLYYCAFTWHPGTTAEQTRQRILQQHQAGTNHPERLRGWYTLAGGGSGFLLVEADDPRAITALCQPYMDLMAFDVRAIYPVEYDAVIQQAQRGD